MIIACVARIAMAGGVSVVAVRLRSAVVRFMPPLYVCSVDGRLRSLNISANASQRTHSLLPSFIITMPSFPSSHSPDHPIFPSYEKPIFRFMTHPSPNITAMPSAASLSSLRARARAHRRGGHSLLSVIDVSDQCIHLR